MPAAGYGLATGPHSFEEDASRVAERVLDDLVDNPRQIAVLTHWFFSLSCRIRPRSGCWRHSNPSCGVYPVRYVAPFRSGMWRLSTIWRVPESRRDACRRRRTSLPSGHAGHCWSLPAHPVEEVLGLLAAVGADQQVEGRVRRRVPDGHDDPAGHWGREGGSVGDEVRQGRARLPQQLAHPPRRQRRRAGAHRHRGPGLVPGLGQARS